MLVSGRGAAVKLHTDTVHGAGWKWYVRCDECGAVEEIAIVSHIFVDGSPPLPRGWLVQWHSCDQNGNHDAKRTELHVCPGCIGMGLIKHQTLSDALKGPK